MNRKLLVWGMALMIFVVNLPGARGQAYEFAVVSNSAAAGVSLSAVANNGNTFVCAGSQDSLVLAANTNYFASFASGKFSGGYLLFSNAWTNTLDSPIKHNWLNCVAAQPNGFIASGASNSVFVSSDGVNWTKLGHVLSASDKAYAADGVAYNPVSGTFAAALAIYEASWTTNPISTNVWRTATLQNESFAESFRGVASFASNSMAMCGILGDIRVSSDGGKVWNVSQNVNLNLPNLLSVASDSGSNVVCAGDKSLIEVTTNGGPNATWTTQTNIMLGSSDSTASFNAMAYSLVANEFLAAGTIDANGGMVMAPEASANANWKWTRQTNLWALQNGNLAPVTTSLPALNGATFANTGFFQGIGMLVGNNGTIIVAGLPPPAPTNSCGNYITNVLAEQQFNNYLGTNSNANIVTDTNHPADVLAMDWYSAPDGGIELATNVFEYQPSGSLYGASGIHTNWAQERDLRTGLASTNRIPFVFYIIPGAPTDPVSATNCDANGQFGMCATTPLSVMVVTNAANPPGTMQINWYDGGSNLVAANTFSNGSDIVSYTPPVPPGIYTYYAQTTNPATGLAGANWTRLTYQLNELPQWTSSAALVTNTALSNPQTNPSLQNPGVSNNSAIIAIEPNAVITYDWYTGSDPTVSTYDNPDAPFAYGMVPGLGIARATGTAAFIPTNGLCGIYTYYVRARVVDPDFTGCTCQSTNLVPVTFTLSPPAPIDAIVDLTNVLAGAVQANTPIWVDVLTNAENPPANFVVNWFSTAQGSNSLNNLNNSSDTNLNDRFFHTPTNALCGIFTNWAETMAIKTGSGSPVVSTNRVAVVFAVIPAAPAAIGPFTQTNCIQVADPTFTVAVTHGQTANWYPVPSRGTPVAVNALTFTPSNLLSGTWEFAAQALDPNTGLSSTGVVTATLTLFDCTNSLDISLNPRTGAGTIQWPGNLTLLSTTNLTPPVVWTSAATGSIFLAPNTLTWTKTNPPVEFFRLTN